MPENETPKAPESVPANPPPTAAEAPLTPEEKAKQEAEAAERKAREEEEHSAEEGQAEEKLDEGTENGNPDQSKKDQKDQGEQHDDQPAKEEFHISMLWKEPRKFFDHVLVKGAMWFRQAATWLRQSNSPFWASVLEWVSNTDVAILFSKLQESAYEIGDTLGDPEKRKPYIDKLKQMYGKMTHLPQYAGGKLNKDAFYELVVSGLEGTQQTWDNIVASAEKLLTAEQEKAKTLPPAGTPAAPGTPASGTPANPAGTPGAAGTPPTGTPQ